MTDRSVLTGRSAVVTGGGRGVGAEVARLLAAGGASVLVAARTSSEVEQVATELRRGGANAFATICDVSPSLNPQPRTRARETFGQIDILTTTPNRHRSAAGATTLDEWKTRAAINATGAFLWHAGVRAGNGRAPVGRVVNVASTLH